MLLALLAMALGMVPPIFGMVPILGCLLRGAWATMLWLQGPPLTRRQRRAVARVLVAAQPEDPVLVICAWNSADPLGLWHAVAWPATVEAAIAAELVNLGATQSTDDPSVFFWKSMTKFNAVGRILSRDAKFQTIMGAQPAIGLVMPRPSIAHTCTIFKASGSAYEVAAAADQFFMFNCR